MKKFGAIFTSVLLAGAMLCSTAASAASTLPQGHPTSGSLTLYKYEHEEEYTADTDGDGYLSDDEINEAKTYLTKKEVKGAKFTAFKVANLTDEGLFTAVDAFKGAKVTFTEEKYGKTEWTLEDLLKQDEYGKAEESKGALTFTSTELFEDLIPALQNIAIPAYEAADNSATGLDYAYDSVEAPDGTYTFSALPLGVYLVVETGVPDGYVISSQSFLVSIPQWNENEDGDGGEWDYTLEALPKDNPVTPDKKIEIDDGDDLDNDPDLVDENIAQVGDNVPYQVTANLPYYGDKLPTSYNSDDLKTTLVYPTEQDFNDTVKAVYYGFADEMSTGLTYNYDMTVEVVNPEGDGRNVTLTKEETKAYDDIVKPNVEKPSQPTVSWEPTDGDYQIKVDGGKISIIFNWAKLNQYQGKQIKLTYSATLNENAEIKDPNTNDVTVTYDNNPTVENDLIIPEPDEVKTYTYGMELTKYFNNEEADGDKIHASGVEFSLSKPNDEDGYDKLWFITPAENSEGNWVSTNTGVYYVYTQDMTANKTAEDPDAEGTAPVEGTHVTIAGKEYIITQKLNPKDDNGFLSVNGLAVGEYKLVEENSIEGFSKLESDVIITVAEGDKNDQGLISGTVKATVGGTTLNTKEDNLGIFLFTVNNVSKQFDLPLTGGAGLLAFTIGGGIVIAGAIIIFSYLRRRRAVR